MKDLMQRLTGAWDLDQWRLSVDGHWRDPYLGPGARGTLIYSADGWMSAVLMAASRPLLGPQGFVSAEVSDKLAAADGYVSYAGKFELDGDEICHHVEFALYPDWIGETLRRHLNWDDAGRLVLTTPSLKTKQGKVIVDEITWKKQIDTRYL